MNLKSILKGTLASAAVFCSIAAGAADAPKKEPPKILIAFYSWSGNTRAAARQIQQVIGGDLFEIKTVKPYPRDHRDCAKFAKKELETKTMPALTGVPDISGYRIIFIGSPNWWGTMATPVYSFIRELDLSGKIVVPFFTHGGGGMHNCETDMKAACKLSKGETVLKAFACSGGSTSSVLPELLKWAEDSVKAAGKIKK